MELSVAQPLHLKNGMGEIQFPEALTRDPSKSSLHIDCLYLPNNSTANDEGLFLVCSASFYRDKKQNMKKNILGMFLNTPTPSVARFGDFWLPLTLPQETIQIECVDFHGERQDVSSLGVVHIRGTVTNKLLAI